MRDFTKVSPTVWDSKLFHALPSDADRLFYLYLLTCPHVNSIGCFKLRHDYAAQDLRIPVENVQHRLDTVSAGSMIRCEHGVGMVFIEKWYQFNPPCNVSHAKHMAKELEKLPKIEIKKEAISQFIAILKEKNIDLGDRVATLCQHRDDTVSTYRDPDPDGDRDLSNSRAQGDDVSRGTYQKGFSGGINNPRRLWEEFPSIMDGRQFYEQLPDVWRLLLEKYISDSDTRLIFCLAYWAEYVGDVPGQIKVQRSHPVKKNWFAAWETELMGYHKRQTEKGLFAGGLSGLKKFAGGR